MGEKDKISNDALPDEVYVHRGANGLLYAVESDIGDNSKFVRYAKNEKCSCDNCVCGDRGSIVKNG